MYRLATQFLLSILLFIANRFDLVDLKEAFPGPAKNQSEQSSLQKEILCFKDSSYMVLVPGGSFVYGIKKATRDSLLRTLSTPILPVFGLESTKVIKHLPSYYIDKYEVTNRQYAQFIKETGHRQPKLWSSPLFNHPDQPVVAIGWADAEAYAMWAGKRLPSEAEWEKAARGPNGFFWPWGDKPSGQKYNGKAQGNYAPVRVGSFPSGMSPCGAMDMAGNVYEMTTGTWGVSGKAMRGGSFLNSAAYTRTMFRWAPEDTLDGASWLGFRCVLDTSFVKSAARSIN